MAKMYDINGNEVKHRDLQNKGAWCIHGLKKELVFVKTYGKQLGLGINPDKKVNKYAPDLISNNGNLADLKTQNTPFFFSNILYKNDPQFTVTFNKNDAERYRANYPNLDIYFWVDWIAVRYYKKSNNPLYDKEVIVEPMQGIWYVPFKDLDQIITNSKLHKYKERINDKKGNAEDSYVINLLDPKIRKII